MVAAAERQLGAPGASAKASGGRWAATGEGDRGEATAARAQAYACSDDDSVHRVREQLREALAAAARWRARVTVEGLPAEIEHLNGEYLCGTSWRAQRRPVPLEPPCFQHRERQAWMRQDLGGWRLEFPLLAAGDVEGRRLVALAEPPAGEPLPPLPPARGWQLQREAVPGLEDHDFHMLRLQVTVAAPKSLDDPSHTKSPYALHCLRSYLRGFGAVAPEDASVQEGVAQLYELPSAYAGVCETYGTSLLELQRALLPEWRPGLAFGSRRQCEEYLGCALPAASALGETRVMEADEEDPSLPPLPRRAFFLELLDGAVLVRVAEPLEALTFPRRALWQEPEFADAALRALRLVPWSRDLNWAFPRRTRLRFEGLAQLAPALGLRRDTFELVLAGLGDLAEQDERCEGQRVQCLVPGPDCTDEWPRLRWASARVKQYEPVTGGVMLDGREGYWYLRQVQARLIRLSGDCNKQHDSCTPHVN